jgi:hypothetical protein
MFGFLRSAATHVADEQQFKGMTTAADFLIRGLSPHYEDDQQNVPTEVVAVLNQIEADIEKATDLSGRNAVYLMGLHKLGEAIGKACAQKALRERSQSK